ncbi:hypothetical protein [Caminibacter pacificus]
MKKHRVGEICFYVEIDNIITKAMVNFLKYMEKNDSYGFLFYRILDSKKLRFYGKFEEINELLDKSKFYFFFLNDTEESYFNKIYSDIESFEKYIMGFHKIDNETYVFEIID